LCLGYTSDTVTQIGRHNGRQVCFWDAGRHPNEASFSGDGMRTPLIIAAMHMS